MTDIKSMSTELLDRLPRMPWATRILYVKPGDPRQYVDKDGVTWLLGYVNDQAVRMRQPAF